MILSYLECDLPLFGSRLASGKLCNLWMMLAHAQGGVANISALARNLEIDRRTMNAHLDLLENLLLVRKLKPWHANTGKRPRAA